MSSADGGRSPDPSGDVLAHISNEMVRAQKKFFGKGPESAKSYMLDDMLIIVMRGGMTTAERTMLDFGQHDMVRDFRQLFENEMSERLTSMIEEATSRKVVNYQSQVMFDPDLIVEMFVFEEPGSPEAREATARDQLGEADASEATDEAAMDSAAGGDR